MHSRQHSAGPGIAARRIGSRNVAQPRGIQVQIGPSERHLQLPFFQRRGQIALLAKLCCEQGGWLDDGRETDGWEILRPTSTRPISVLSVGSGRMTGIGEQMLENPLPLQWASMGNPENRRFDADTIGVVCEVNSSRA